MGINCPGNVFCAVNGVKLIFDCLPRWRCDWDDATNPGDSISYCCVVAVAVAAGGAGGGGAAAEDAVDAAVAP